MAFAAMPAQAGTITAHAVAASANPALVPGTSSLVNGDFTIGANPAVGASGAELQAEAMEPHSSGESSAGHSS